MSAISRFATRHPVWFALASMVTWAVLLVGFMGVASGASAEPVAQHPAGRGGHLAAGARRTPSCAARCGLGCRASPLVRHRGAPQSLTEPRDLPGIVLHEVLSGIRSQRQFTDLTATLPAAFTVAPEGSPEHVEAARIKNVCLGKGPDVPGDDCLIVACAITGNHESFAIDENVEAIARLAPLRRFRGHDLA
jgi:predicted nucleic acid-binding protein